MGKAHFIPGFHAVKETLLKNRTGIDQLWIKEGKISARAKEIVHLAEKKGIPLYFKKGSVLDDILPGIVHQGIAALSKEFNYSNLEHIIDIAMSSSGYAMLLAVDHITDEGNLGAIIRTAAFFQVQGLILPKKRSAGVTEKVRKRSSGAYIHLPVARVTNLGNELNVLNKKGFWIIGAAGESPDSIYHFDWRRDTVLVVGSEDRGLSRSIRGKCHQLVSIPPLSGMMESLNVSVASGVILSEIFRQRMKKINSAHS